MTFSHWFVPVSEGFVGSWAVSVIHEVMMQIRIKFSNHVLSTIFLIVHRISLSAARRNAPHRLVVGCQYTLCCSTSCWSIWGGGHRLVVWDVSTLCAVVPPAGVYGVVGTGWL
jgi:hypothetical protein